MNNNPNLGNNPQVFSNVLGAKYLSETAGASAILENYCMYN